MILYDKIYGIVKHAFELSSQLDFIPKKKKRSQYRDLFVEVGLMFFMTDGKIQVILTWNHGIVKQKSCGDVFLVCWYKSYIWIPGTCTKKSKEYLCRWKVGCIYYACILYANFDHGVHIWHNFCSRLSSFMPTMRWKNFPEKKILYV